MENGELGGGRAVDIIYLSTLRYFLVIVPTTYVVGSSPARCTIMLPLDLASQLSQPAKPGLELNFMTMTKPSHFFS